ncbi:MAG: alpha/beta fold hydrolase [Burkholderiales bacterium]
MILSVDGRPAFAYTAAHAIDPAKPAVVFLHGAGYDHSIFGLQSRYFGYHGRNVLALDFPAHGRSEGRPLPTIEEMADWVLRVLDAAQLRKASIVGHSMGALVALECAARHAARVERIALLGIAYPMKVGEAFMDAARRNDRAAYDMETIWGHSYQGALGANPNPGMSMYGESLARLERLAPGVLYNDLKACHEYAGGEAAAARLACPVLVVLGRRDQMAPAKSGAAFAKTLPDARLLPLEAPGHSLMTEAPDAVLDALIGFLG